MAGGGSAGGGGFSVSEERMKGFKEGLLQAAIYIRRNPGKSKDLIASDLEDTAAASSNPSECSHPFWNARDDGSSYCRTCGTDTTEMEGMGS